jgi:hypothetical protein
MHMPLPDLFLGFRNPPQHFAIGYHSSTDHLPSPAKSSREQSASADESPARRGEGTLLDGKSYPQDLINQGARPQMEK